MFYGELKREGDINITDATADAFKEFLQFFYRSQVKLTTGNIPEVMNLGKQYLLNDCIKACTDFCERTLTVDNMCWGYELSILFELESLKKFCEDQISEKTPEIFRSSSFLNCEPNLLRHILHLDSLKCDESVVFDGCMAWAKACVRKGLDGKDMQNLRSQLGDLFYEIRFGELSHKDYQERYRLYEELFSFKEYKDINMMIACKEFQPEKFNRNARTFPKENDHNQSCNEDIMVCERLLDKSKISDRRYHIPLGPHQKVGFISSSWLMLKQINCLVICPNLSIKTEIRLYEKCNDQNGRGTLLYYSEISLENGVETLVDITGGVIIQPGRAYTFEFELLGKRTVVLGLRDLSDSVSLKEGTKIDFSTAAISSILKGLYFIRLNK